MKLNKGTVIYYDYIFIVVNHDTTTNNIDAISTDNNTYFLNLNKFKGGLKAYEYTYERNENIKNRHKTLTAYYVDPTNIDLTYLDEGEEIPFDFPYQEVLEVVLGKHDRRFK
jgi:hypothetical protein